MHITSCVLQDLLYLVELRDKCFGIEKWEHKIVKYIFLCNNSFINLYIFVYAEGEIGIQYLPSVAFIVYWDVLEM